MMYYKRCKECGYLFRLSKMHMSALKQRRQKPSCPSCGSKKLMRCFKVEYLKNRGMMNKDSWKDYKLKTNLGKIRGNNYGKKYSS